VSSLGDGAAATAQTRAFLALVAAVTAWGIGWPGDRGATGIAIARPLWWTDHNLRERSR